MNEVPGSRTRLHSPFRIVINSLAAAFCLLGAVSFIQAGERKLPIDVSYESDHRLVSVTAQSVPLSDVLHELAAKAGFEIHVDPSVSLKVLQYFKGLPLEKAIQRLAGPYQTLLVYDTEKAKRPLCKVHVMARTKPANTAAPADARRPDMAALNEYGLAWLAARYDSAPRFLPAASIDAALSWQNYLVRLNRKQRAELHARMLKAHRERTEAGQLAVSYPPAATVRRQ